MNKDWEGWEEEEEYLDEDLGDEPYCFGSYTPGDETCDFRCELSELCEKISKRYEDEDCE